MHLEEKERTMNANQLKEGNNEDNKVEILSENNEDEKELNQDKSIVVERHTKEILTTIPY